VLGFRSFAFVIGAGIIYSAFHVLGEVAYLPPQSFGEFWHELQTSSLGCS
jgi:hypothetical protein